MIIAILATLSLTATSDASCPPISLADLQPAPGDVYQYAFWRDGQRQPGELDMTIVSSTPGEVRVDYSLLLANGQRAGLRRYRALAGIILRSENDLSGSSPRQSRFPGISPAILDQSLAEGDEVRIAAVETARLASGETLRHQGDYTISHAGCGELVHEGETVQTRKLRLSYFQYLGTPDAGWTLTEPIQIYDIPVGASWFYTQYREGNHPMQQGTIMQGYTVP